MQIKGSVVVEGLAVGTLQFFHTDYQAKLDSYEALDTAKEKERYQNALEEAKKDLADLLEKREQLAKNEAEILEAHQLLLEDMALQDTISGYLEQEMSAPQAILQAVDDFKAMFDGIDDEYLKERQKDIVDVGNRLMRKLLHIEEFEVRGEQAILYAKDIEPSIMAGLSEKQVKAVLLESGSKTSHTVIIAKSKGFVTLVGVQLDESAVAEGSEVIVDANRGIVIVDPKKEELESYKEHIRQQEERKEYLLTRAKLPAQSKDGRSFTVSANISNPDDMKTARERGCTGVGLYRTEFLFMQSSELPTEEEQFAAYKKVLEQADGELCIIRTLDIGGDKHCECLGLEQEDNPFLGYRAIRICMNQQEIFRTQLRALLRAGSYGKLGIMIPMVTTLEEITVTKDLIEELKSDLQKENLPYGKDVQVGIMVETPASAVMAPLFAKHVDFFSIGTNDLVQYTMAVDRGNQKVSYLYDYFQPSVIHSIHRVVTAAHKAGIWVGMCGEMAGDKLALPFLMGIGMDELSMSSSVAPQVKERIRNLDCGECDMDKLLSLESAGQIRAYLKSLEK